MKKIFLRIIQKRLTKARVVNQLMAIGLNYKTAKYVVKKSRHLTIKELIEIISNAAYKKKMSLDELESLQKIDFLIILKTLEHIKFSLQQNSR